jgi:hypothetical protein
MPTLPKNFIQQAYLLGFAGLIPFWSLSLAFYWPGIAHWPFLPLALTAYAGLIASFLGGIYWGLALWQGRYQQLWWSVMPALLVWGISFLPLKQELIAFILLFVVLLLVERHWLCQESSWQWFWRLRQYLTWLVCLALLVAWFAV